MIRVDKLRKTFGDRVVLRDISMVVRPGEIAGIIGPSGGGKTTLLRCINFLTEFDGGSVFVDDVELRAGLQGPELQDRIAQIRSRVGMVFQQFNLFPHKTALGNIIEAPIHVRHQARDEAERQARALLEQVGLTGRADAYPARLSGGEQQRVAIARALAMSPEVILFDEPTSALDPERVSDLIVLLKGLATHGITMLIVTHAIGFLRAVADTVYFMAEGEFVEVGSPAEVLGRPRQERTRRFLSQEELLE